MKKNKIILPLLTVMLTAAFPAIFLYCNNAEEVSFSEIIPILSAFLLVSLGFFCLVYLLVRNPNKTVITVDGGL